jgi:hypothetical protein
MRLLIFFMLFFSLSNVHVANSRTIDGSSKDAYERSVKAMTEGMSKEDKEIFGHGLLSLILTRYPPAQGAKGFEVLQLMAPALEAAHITLDGLSLDEILAAGRKEKEAKEVKSAEQDGKSDNFPTDLDCLQKRILLTKVKIEKSDFGRNLSVDVTNRLSWPISAVRIEYIAQSVGRSVPWHQHDFFLSIDGGIEPNETRTISTTAFVSNEAPDDLNVSAVILDVADQKKRQFIKEVSVAGWSDEKTKFQCQAAD